MKALVRFNKDDNIYKEHKEDDLGVLEGFATDHDKPSCAVLNLRTRKIVFCCMTEFDILRYVDSIDGINQQIKKYNN